MIAYQLLLNWGQLFVPAGTAIIIIAAAPLAGVAFVCLARAGVSLSAAVRIVVAAMVVQDICHPLQHPLLTKYSSLEVACYAMIAGTVMTLPSFPPVAVLIAWVWLGERTILPELLGGLIVIAGVVVISQGPRLLARRTAGVTQIRT